MTVKTWLLTIFSIVLVFPLTLGSTFYVHAIPGVGVSDPANIFSTSGPMLNHLLMQFYGSGGTELSDFQTGGLDLADVSVPSSQWSAFDSNPDFLQSPVQTQFEWSGIDLNQNSSTWASWGCNFSHGNSACGIDVRQGFAHLIDRATWVATGPLLGAGQAIVDPSPFTKDPEGSDLPTQISWDTIPSQRVIETSAFHIATAPSGFATPGSPDFCAAADHMIVAGLATAKSTSTCVLQGVSPSIPANPIRFKIRNTEPRRNLGLGLAN